MAVDNVQSGLAAINGAEIYYEVAGEGQPLVMIHAGVADHRQWNNEFTHFAQQYRVLRYDMRGYGKSEPVEGEFSHLADLVALLNHLNMIQPVVLIGCSMGGGTAMDFTLMYPARAKALIMVDSGPNGLDLDVPSPEKFNDAEKAYEAGDWDLLAEIETQIWFDGMNRTPDQVEPKTRQLAHTMNRIALGHEAKGLGKRVANITPPAAERMGELDLPILVVVGANDIPYMHAAADMMTDTIPSAQKVIIYDAAHLPNMEHPAEFQRIVDEFLGSLSD